MGELRLILLALGVLMIAAIWWGSARRSRQAPGNAELRESTLSAAASVGHGAAVSAAHGVAVIAAHGAAAGDAEPIAARRWGVPPLEPLSIRTADFEQVLALDQPMLTHADPLPVLVAPAPPAATAPAAPAPGAIKPGALKPGATAPSAMAPPPALEPNASEKQKILTFRVCAVGDERWSGAALMSLFEAHGLAYGRYQVFHRKHSDGRSIFYVASLVEPGIFDLASMTTDEFRGVSLFAVLPGPLEPLQTLDALLSTARELAKQLSGTLQDAKGMTYSPQRLATLREDLARFHAPST